MCENMKLIFIITLQDKKLEGKTASVCLATPIRARCEKHTPRQQPQPRALPALRTPPDAVIPGSSRARHPDASRPWEPTGPPTASAPAGAFWPAPPAHRQPDTGLGQRVLGPPHSRDPVPPPLLGSSLFSCPFSSY